MALNPKPAHSAPLTVKEATKYLGCSQQFLDTDRHVSMQNGTPPVVPYLRIGPRIIRYLKADLDAVLSKFRVGA